MRIDTFTSWTTIDDNHYIFNIKTGAVDKISPEFLKKIIELKEIGSFSDNGLYIDSTQLYQLVQKGYVTSLSETELARSKDTIFESTKNELKNMGKTAAIMFDNLIASKWCSDGEIKLPVYWNTSVSLFGKIVTHLKTFDPSVKYVDIWFDFSNQMPNVQDIAECIRENGLGIKGVYVSLPSDCNEEKAISELSLWNEYSEYLICRSDKTFKKVLKVKKGIAPEWDFAFCSFDRFFCPFIYRTYFIDNNGNVYFCLNSLVENAKPVDNIFNATEDISVITKDWFSPICTNSFVECDVALYCNKGCGYLHSLYEEFNEISDCKVRSKLREFIELKLQFLVKS